MRPAVPRLDFATYLKQEPVTLAFLTGIAVMFFLAVSALARMHDSQQVSLARRLAAQGVLELKSANFAPAVENFRAALVYSRDNGSYRLSLAQALIGLKRYDEAKAYLTNLREREPDNGLVSLELARVAVQQQQTEDALRFYHNAIYSNWPGSEDAARQRAQLELIDYLLRIRALPQADAELIDYEASLGQDAAQQSQLGAMFAKAGDDHRALSAYAASLHLNRHNPEALTGAGAAAYRLGEYSLAERYLRGALALNPDDAASADLLAQTQTVLRWDPLRQQMPSEERNQIAVRAFDAAGARLKTCNPPTPPQQSLQQNWTKLQPQATTRALREDPDLITSDMDLVFDIETQTAGTCGAQTETDRALLLVAGLHGED